MWFINSDKFEKPTNAPDLSEEPLFIHRRSQEAGNRKLLIFVHGLNGDRYGTWDMFPKFIFEEEENLHNVDIGMYAYVTGLRSLWLASIELDREARVMADILRDAKDYDGIILVGHSMGGLLIKAAIADLIERLDRTTLTRIAGVFLLATPQLGSLRVPGFLSWLGKDMRALRPHSKLVTKITQTFYRRVVGSEDSQMHGDDNFVIPVWVVVAAEDFWVDELSAGITTPDKRRKDVRGLHTRIVKPQHRTEDAYRWVVVNIAECFKHYSAPQAPESTYLAAERGRPSLDSYLDALLHYYRDAPYAAVRNLTPPLGDIYIESLMDEIPRSSAGQVLASPGAHQATLTEALTRFDHLIVDGAAGIGKSTCLNDLTVRLAREAKTNRAHDLVPVRVAAATLLSQSGSMRVALRDAAGKSLSLYLRDELPDDFFASPPAGGGRWLVMVDAVDQVYDVDARKKLLNALVQHAADEQRRYRFVVVSRPLEDFKQISFPDFGHYRLKPFTHEDANRFVRGWFASRDRPELDARRFMAIVMASRMGDLASIPLLLTMALLVYERATAGLPNSRAALYEEFIRVLLEEDSRQLRDNSGHLLEEWYLEWRVRYGKRGETLADDAIIARRDLLEHAASGQQLKDVAELSGEAAACFARTNKLRSVDEHWLRERLSYLLCRSGIISRRGNREEFLHDTVREYLTACRQVTICSQESKFANQWDSVQSWQVVKHWRDPRWREVVLFALGIWSENGVDVTEPLEQILHESPEGLLFTAEAAADGVRIGPDFADLLANGLMRQADGLLRRDYDPDHPVKLLRRLAQTGIGVPQIEKLARKRDTWRYPLFERSEAFRCLADLGRLDELLAIARDATERATFRAKAAELVGEHGRAEEFTELLAEIAREEDHDGAANFALSALCRFKGAGVDRALLSSCK